MAYFPAFAKGLQCATFFGTVLTGMTESGKLSSMRWMGLFFSLMIWQGFPVHGLTIETAYSRFYGEGDIRPIRQYFGGSLSGQRFRTVIASQPDSPEGQYFITRLKDQGNPEIRSVKMTLITTASKEPLVHTWKIDEKLSKWLYLGLTGSDWLDEAIQPLAWKIELLDAEDKLIAEWKSFLWELKPET